VSDFEYLLSTLQLTKSKIDIFFFAIILKSVVILLSINRYRLYDGNNVQELAVLYHKLSKAGKMKIVEELDKDGWLMDAAQYIFSDPREERYRKMLEEISL